MDQDNDVPDHREHGPRDEEGRREAEEGPPPRHVDHRRKEVLQKSKWKMSC